MAARATEKGWHIERKFVRCLNLKGLVVSSVGGLHLLVGQGAEEVDVGAVDHRVLGTARGVAHQPRPLQAAQYLEQQQIG